ncbi:hypothetical protein CMV30_13325 [Nibricoccus aquaticus]|uniref:Uncharacterized protein n=1 Tax=Nibricoccus aquaticus TaxID=2576891 RepID=A0A290Q895_9BACT|nr:hypothetical protein [Nibricoccus aquaticus]ATC64869.1 hypothetical protein CMV30_13325 [Nibricoccus aquaticus]
MHLWKIQNGIPSLADNILVAAGLSLGVGAFVLSLNCALEFFEARGFNYLGYFAVFSVFGVLGGLGLWLFMRNEKLLRAEVIVPRRVFGFGTATVLIMITTALISDLFQSDLATTGLVVIGFYTIAYSVIVQCALRWPSRTTSFSLWLSLTLGALGVLAKALKLFVAK